jgi:methyltransferase
MLFEVSLSRRNSRRLLSRGAVEIAPRILPLMVVMYIVMYIGSPLEYRFLWKEISLEWEAFFLGVFLIAKALKFWAIKALGTKWTMRVLIVPGSEVVTGGPYRWMRHPNYAAVLLEIAAIPLLGKSFLTFAVVWSAFVVLLYYRIRAEDAALAKYTNFDAK